MFHTVADRVNQTAARPVRSAIKKWRLLAVNIQEKHLITHDFSRREVLLTTD